MPGDLGRGVVAEARRRQQLLLDGAEEEVLAHAELLCAAGGGRGGVDAVLATLVWWVVDQLLDGPHLEGGQVRWEHIQDSFSFIKVPRKYKAYTAVIPGKLKRSGLLTCHPLLGWKIL